MVAATSVLEQVTSRADGAPDTHMGRACEIQAHCDLCGPDQAGVLRARAGDFDVLACARCRLLWTRPLYYLDSKAAEVGGDYWAAEVYLAQAREQKRRFRGQVRRWLRVARAGDLRKLRVLEVGCGLGFLLDVLEEYGVRAEGCDIAEQAVAHANTYRKRARAGELDGHYQEQSFDAVFAMNLIEHLPHPRPFLAECRRVLRPGGLLVLETPVQESLMHRAGAAGYALSGGRLQLFGLAPGGHVTKFSRRTFAVAGDDLGFRVVWQRNVSSPFGEIWGKRKHVRFSTPRLYRLALPPLHAAGRALSWGNRLFLMMERM